MVDIIKKESEIKNEICPVKCANKIYSEDKEDERERMKMKVLINDTRMG